MTLNLYNYYGSDDIENIFCWAPDDEQWWITGFKPSLAFPKAEEMVALGTINFEEREGMYNSLKEEIENDKELKDYMIFDEDGHTVWLILWEAA